MAFIEKPSGSGSNPLFSPLQAPESGVLIPGIPRPVSGPVADPSTFRRLQISTGARGTTETLRAMADLIVEASQDPYFVQFTRNIVRSCASKDYLCEADALLQYVKQNVTYRQDPLLMEWVQSPGWTMFVERQGDCDDSSSLLAAMDLAAGHGAELVAVATERSNPSEYTHVFTRVGLRTPGGGVEWLGQDAVPTPARLGWEVPRSMWVMAPNVLTIASP